MKRDEKRVRAHRSAKSPVKQTQNPARDPNLRLIYVPVPKSWLPAIDQAAKELGLSRSELINEACREKLRSKARPPAATEHPAKPSASVPAALATEHPKSSNDKDLKYARQKLAAAIHEWHFKEPGDATAEMACFAALIAHHPGLRAECEAMRMMDHGETEMGRLMESANDSVTATRHLALSESDLWFGSYCTVLYGGDASLEYIMNQLCGLGAIMADHKPSEAMGRMVMGMESAWKVLVALVDETEEEDRPKDELLAEMVETSGRLAGEKNWKQQTGLASKLAAVSARYLERGRMVEKLNAECRARAAVAKGATEGGAK